LFRSCAPVWQGTRTGEAIEPNRRIVLTNSDKYGDFGRLTWLSVLQWERKLLCGFKYYFSGALLWSGVRLVSGDASRKRLGAEKTGIVNRYGRYKDRRLVSIEIQ